MLAGNDCGTMVKKGAGTRERRDVGPNHMYSIDIVAPLRSPFDREVCTEEVSQPVDIELLMDESSCERVS